MGEKLTTESCIAAFDRVSEELPGGGEDWLARRRAKALDAFRSAGLPTPRLEDWKYTDVRPITSREYSLDVGAEIPETIEIPSVEGFEPSRMVFVNGRFDSGRSRLDGLPVGVIAGNLADALVDEPGAVEPWLGRALPADGHGFSALNDAFVNDGAFIRIDTGVEVESPIEIVFVASGGAEAPLIQPRNIIVVGEGARVNLVERYVGAGDTPYLTNLVSELFLEPGAEIELNRVQEEGVRAGHIGGLFVRQRADSRAVLTTVSLDGLMIRNDVRVFLDEPGAECRLNGLVLGNGRQHIDNHTTVEHLVERCVSREFYKSVLDARARSVFHGRIIVHPDAQQTDSEQQNQNLLLSRDAEVDTKPQLEIYADDVKCSHGATVGQLDEGAVFYLRSRGVDEADARALLTIAFADSAVADVSSEALRAHVDERIRQKLGYGARREDEGVD